jgi:hypothetical protein
MKRGRPGRRAVGWSGRKRSMNRHAVVFLSRGVVLEAEVEAAFNTEETMMKRS